MLFMLLVLLLFDVDDVVDIVLNFDDMLLQNFTDLLSEKVSTRETITFKNPSI